MSNTVVATDLTELELAVVTYLAAKAAYDAQEPGAKAAHLANIDAGIWTVSEYETLREVLDVATVRLAELVPGAGLYRYNGLYRAPELALAASIVADLITSR